MACMPLAPTRKMAVAGAHPGNAALATTHRANKVKELAVAEEEWLEATQAMESVDA